jgi:hypothetical protein
MTHKEYIELVKESGIKMFNPYLEWPFVNMTLLNYTIEDYAQQLVDEYIDAGIPSSRVLFLPLQMSLQDTGQIALITPNMLSMVIIPKIFMERKILQGIG